ncbi:MAG: NeuD/PglB/VioB family sugar acetyltransferase [Sulfurovaceae bacterium]
MKEKILLIGGGGHCKSVIDVLEQENKYKIIGIIDKEELVGTKVLDYEIIGYDGDLESIFKTCKNALITVGQIESSKIRVKLFDRLKEIGFNLPVIISPLAYISKHSFVDEGTVVMHHALVNVNAKIGKNCIINTKALVEHDAVIENHCHVSTGAIVNGGVVVKENSFVGSNSVIKHGIEVSGFIKAGSIEK